jgi:hypothetical protein
MPRVSDERLAEILRLVGPTHYTIDMYTFSIVDLADDLRDARTELSTLRAERNEAITNHQFMVERAADEKLDDYRELGARAAAAESERDILRAALEAADALREKLFVIQESAAYQRVFSLAFTHGCEYDGPTWEKELKAYIRARAATQTGSTSARPTIVCLCGSTRFMDYFHEAGWQLTMEGKIVLSVGCSKHLPADHGGEALGVEIAARLDELHLRKIDLADEVFVLNVDGYIGESTRREIAYAMSTGKPVHYLEP